MATIDPSLRKKPPKPKRWVLSLTRPARHWASMRGLRFLHRANGDRKSTRLNSSHSSISYAVFCLKKKKGSDRTRVVLNLRRAVSHEATLDGRSLIVTLSEPAVAQTAPGGQVAHFSEGKADPKHAIRDVDFRRGRGGEARVVVDLSDSTTGIDIRTQGQNIVVEFLKTFFF